MLRLAAALLVFALAAPAYATSTVYSDRALWEAAATGPIYTETFDAIPDQTTPITGGTLHTPLFDVITSPRVHGTASIHFGYLGSDLHTGEFDLYTFSMPITAFAVDVLYVEVASVRVTILGEPFGFGIGNPSISDTFFGVVSDTPFTTVLIDKPGSAPSIYHLDNLSIVPLPEPPAAAFALAGLAAAVCLRPRRRSRGLTPRLIRYVATTLLALVLAGPAHATSTVYTDRAAWEAAVAGPISTETFEVDPVQRTVAGVGGTLHATLIDIVVGPSTFAVSLGYHTLRGEVRSAHLGFNDLVFPDPIYAFGLHVGTIEGDGGLKGDLPLVMYIDGQEFQAAQGSFFGIVSDSLFSTVRIAPEDHGLPRAYELGDVSFAVPEPAGLSALAAALLLATRCRR